jgi:hypothetical protein
MALGRLASTEVAWVVVYHRMGDCHATRPLFGPEEIGFRVAWNGRFPCRRVSRAAVALACAFLKHGVPTPAAKLSIFENHLHETPAEATRGFSPSNGRKGRSTSRLLLPSVRRNAICDRP